MVCAGELMMNEIKRQGATLLPADPEHNAIFQVFDFGAVKDRKVDFDRFWWSVSRLEHPSDGTG